jgi:site-specific recombinase XerD
MVANILYWRFFDMNNKAVLKKMKKNMHMRNFSKYTYDNYVSKAKDILKYFGEKQLENVTTDELRDFLLKYLKEEKKLSDRSVNYYNSVIRFV